MMESTFKPAPLRDAQWKELQKLNPQDVCQRASVMYDEQGFYTLMFIKRMYYVHVHEERIEGSAEDDILADDIEFILLVLTYLISAQDVPFSGKQVSENDIPGGFLFFKGPHVLPVAPLLKCFGNDRDAFLACGTRLGGSRTAYGDAAVEFLALPRIPLICILWVADEEFPARVNFLFDSSIEYQLPLDVILALVRSVSKLMLE